MNTFTNKILAEGFIKRYGENSGYYKKGETFLQKYDNNLSLYTVPNDIEKKLTYASLPTLADLDYYYTLFNDFEKRDLYLQDHFAFDGSYLKRKNVDGDIVQFYFATAKEYVENRGVKFVIDSGKESINLMFKNYIAENLSFDDYKLNNKDLPLRTQFYDKASYSAANALQQSKDYAKQIALQKQEAEEKERQILREQEKARKAAETTAIINSAANSIINTLNSYKK